MHISWDNAQTFLGVSEQGSFSAAARLLGVGQPTVSRRIAALEAQLGVQLFTRGKYGVALTAAARELLPAAQQMARGAGEFDRLASGHETLVSGTVSIAAPPGVAVEQLAPFARHVREHLPDIRLQVLAGIQHIDLTRGTADLALRTKQPNEPELLCLHSFEVPQGVFAAPDYAARVSQPCSWADLDWVTWAPPLAHVEPRPLLERVIENFEAVFTSDDYLVQVAAVKAGVGAMFMGRATTPVAEPRGAELVELDLGIQLPAGALHLVCARSMQHVPRVRAVADLLIEAAGG